MITAIFPGSFDPITNGHLDIIKRASWMFDRVIVLVLNNIDKNTLFSIDERKLMISLVIEDLENVFVDTYDGLLANYVGVKDVVIIKGVRSIKDFEYEFEMAMINKKLNINAETVFIPASEDKIYISSKILKHLLLFNEDVTWMLPKNIKTIVEKRLKGN